jgi:hypothetical protein
LPSSEPKAAAARGSHRDNWRNLILVLKATLKSPRLAPGTRLKIGLEDHGVTGVSGQQPPPIFRPERASPQGYRRLRSGRSPLERSYLPEDQDLEGGTAVA